MSCNTVEKDELLRNISLGKFPQDYAQWKRPVLKGYTVYSYIQSHNSNITEMENSLPAAKS